MNQNQKTSPLSVFRYLRNFCGISMEALAEAVGVSYLTVFNMELFETSERITSSKRTVRKAWLPIWAGIHDFRFYSA